jgi:heptosyltransferase II
VKKILVIQTAFLGDVILATPIAENLKNNFPNCAIHYLVKKGNESLLDNHKFIDKVWTFDKSKGKFSNILRLSKTFKKEEFDIIYNLHRFASSGIIATLSKGKELFGFKKNPLSIFFTKSFPHEIGNGKHEVDRNLALLGSLKCTPLIRKPSLFPSDSDREKVFSLKIKSYYCIAPASVWATKQMPKEKWVELLLKLSEKGKIYVLGSPSDYSFCQEIIDESGSIATNLAGQLSLLQSAELMRDATRSFVNDSGPLHLASSVNAKVSAFFCSTIPAFGFGPLSDESKIMETEEQLECRPCGLHGYKACPKGHFKCGNISIDV